MFMMSLTIPGIVLNICAGNSLADQSLLINEEAHFIPQRAAFVWLLSNVTFMQSAIVALLGTYYMCSYCKNNIIDTSQDKPDPLEYLLDDDAEYCGDDYYEEDEEVQNTSINEWQFRNQTGINMSR